jgi:glycerophosphoryl diester phosphodiesterase
VHLPLPVASTPGPVRSTRRPLNVAHRGASADAPENTLAAVRRAIDLGADRIEVDVQRSRDGAMVLMHDTTLTRTTNARKVFPLRAPWRVADFTHAELRRLDAGSWKSPAYAGEPIPTLDEVVEVLEQAGAGLLLELKAPELYPGVVSDLRASLEAVPGYVSSAAADHRLVVQSFGFAAMKELKTQLPAVPVGLLGAPPRANLPALASWAHQVNPSHRLVDRSYVDAVHDLGMQCLVWTVNRGPSMRRALRIGVDGVITNRPGLLGQVLAAR